MCVYIHTHIYIYICIYIYTYTRAFAADCVCTAACRPRINVCIHIYIYIYVYIYTYVYSYVNIYICTCIYIHIYPCPCRRLCVHSSVQAMLLQRICLGRFAREHFVQLSDLPLKRQAFRLSLPLLLLHYLLPPLARHPIRVCLLAFLHGRFLLRLCESLCVRLSFYLLPLMKRGTCHSAASLRVSLFRRRFALRRGLVESNFFRANLLLARVALCHYLARRSRIVFGCFLGCCALVHGLFLFNLLLRCLHRCLHTCIEICMYTLYFDVL